MMSLLLTLFFSLQGIAENLSTKVDPFKIHDHWSLVNFQKHLNGCPTNDLAIKISRRMNLALRSPISALGIASESFANPVPIADINEIANQCKHFTSTIKKIACAVDKVRVRLSNGDFGDFSTFCRAHAVTFEKVFKRLDIPRSNAMGISADFVRCDGETVPHRVNQIMLTDRDGQVFSYVIDVGNLPGLLFPISHSARSFHDPNNDGRIENMIPPEFPLDLDDINFRIMPTTESVEEKEVAQ